MLYVDGTCKTCKEDKVVDAEGRCGACAAQEFIEPEKEPVSEVPCSDRVMPQCVCEGNWRIIIKECAHLLGRKYKDINGKEYTFFGVVWGEDDYYYGMWRRGDMRLLTCVGSLEAQGFKLEEA